MLEFKKITDFPRGTIYNILQDAYSYDARNQETVWLTQKQMGELFDVKQATISEHINNILESGELSETSIGFLQG